MSTGSSKTSPGSLSFSRVSIVVETECPVLGGSSSAVVMNTPRGVTHVVDAAFRTLLAAGFENRTLAQAFEQVGSIRHTLANHIPGTPPSDNPHHQ